MAEQGAEPEFLTPVTHFFPLFFPVCSFLLILEVPCVTCMQKEGLISCPLEVQGT